MKHFLLTVAALALGFTAPALAQSENTMTSTSTPTTSCGTVCPGTGGVLIDVRAGAGHAGDFRAMYSAGPNGTGSATAEKEGGAYSVFDIVYDSCQTSECGVARVTAGVGGYEIGQSMATATTAAPDEWAIAQNTGTAQTAGMLQVTILRPSLPSGHTQNGN